jgi:hypothetical protein
MTSILITRKASYDLLIDNTEQKYPAYLLTILATRFYPAEEHSLETAETTEDLLRFMKEHKVFFVKNADIFKRNGILPPMRLTIKGALDAGDRLGDVKSGLDYFHNLAFSRSSQVVIRPHLIMEQLLEGQEYYESFELINYYRGIIMDGIALKLHEEAIESGELPPGTCKTMRKDLCLYGCGCY